MQDLIGRNFGLLIAYVIPGFIVLWGVGFVDGRVADWLSGSATQAGPTVGGFLYVTIASVGLGMTASAVRWLVVDTIHHATGLVRPRWSDRPLHERIDGYTWIIENHYRYYQFYGNSAVALLFTALVWRVSSPEIGSGLGWIDASVIAVTAVLFAGSRSALELYYRRAESLLGPDMECADMTNGGSPKKPIQTKPKTETKQVGDKAGTTQPKPKE